MFNLTEVAPTVTPVTTGPELLINALACHIQQSTMDMSLLSFYCCHNPELTPAEVQAITKLLYTSWSTEYALRATVEIGSDNMLGGESYVRAALHWTLPQLHHAVSESLKAFMYTLGVRSNNGQLLRREVGRLVVKSAYPRATSFYAAGAYGDFTTHRLPLSGYAPGLHVASLEITAQRDLAACLRHGRKCWAQTARQQVQDNPNTAIRSQKTGKPLAKWTTEHWQQITWRLGYTTVFDLLHDLGQGKHELAQATDARQFCAHLLTVLDYFQFVHEAYVVKAIGGGAYESLVADLPAHLQNGFVQERMARHSAALS